MDESTELDHRQRSLVAPPPAFPRRRRTRLNPEFYADPAAICFTTVATRGRARLFADRDLARMAVELLRSRADETGVRVYAYCLMPDHVHLLLGASETCDLMTFVGQYKNLVQRAAWERGVRGRIWQTGFWDHFLRAEEALEDVVTYVLENPLRRGLVENWDEYEYSGSLVFDLRSDGGGQAPALQE